MRRKNPSIAFSTHPLILVTPHSADPDPDPEVGVVVPGVVGAGVAGLEVVDGGVTHRLGAVVVVGGVVVGAGVAGVGVTGTVGVGVGVAGWAAAPAAPMKTISSAASTAVAAAMRVAGVTLTGAGGACAVVCTVRLRRWT
ncbi:hypothetical protein [Nocardia salmonicida]|uniref:hypothetical protein n=1 Tax=Nocardia salmonicida TaxID=53431 RepID=UPI00343154F3